MRQAAADRYTRQACDQRRGAGEAVLVTGG